MLSGVSRRWTAENGAAPTSAFVRLWEMDAEAATEPMNEDNGFAKPDAHHNAIYKTSKPVVRLQKMQFFYCLAMVNKMCVFLTFTGCNQITNLRPKPIDCPTIES